MTFSAFSGSRSRPASAGDRQKRPAIEVKETYYASAGDRRPAHAAHTAHGRGSLSTVELGEPWRSNTECCLQAALPPAAPGPDKDLRGWGRVEDISRGDAAEEAVPPLVAIDGGGGEDGERDAAMSAAAGGTGEAEGSVRAPPAAGLEGGAGAAAVAAAVSAALDARMLELTRKHAQVQILITY
jgi:hypothetical protein